MGGKNANLVAEGVRRVRAALHARYDSTKGPVQSLELRQKATLIDKGPSSSVRAVQATIPAPSEDDLRLAILEAFERLADGDQPRPFLTAESIKIEWVAPRSQDEKIEQGVVRAGLEELNEAVRNENTIIFVHGGAFFQNGLGVARSAAAKLSKFSGSRVVVVDYRLAPQYAFPSQIMDVCLVYLSLLYPPSGSLHSPVDPGSIVLTGESVGGNIAMGLLQTLLQMQNKTVRFNGRTVPVPLPGGISVASCQAEVALCLPSWHANKEFDIFDDQAPFLKEDFPADSIWPTSPPREDVYCKAAYSHHPMVSPCTAKSWKNAPPMWLCFGQERLADSCKVLAQTAARDGVCVTLEQYEAMPHCWMFSLPKLPHSQQAFQRWGESCSALLKTTSDQVSQGRWISVETLEESELDVTHLIDFGPHQAREWIREKARRMPIFYGKTAVSHL